MSASTIFAGSSIYTGVRPHRVDPNSEAKLDGLDWEKWRTCSKEVNGRYADPRFVDARNFDFRLKPDSPAFALGFKPFDYTRAGVRAPRQCASRRCSASRTAGRRHTDAPPVLGSNVK